MSKKYNQLKIKITHFFDGFPKERAIEF